MNNDIQISFCLPVYNVVNFVEECLQSIVSQCFIDSLGGMKYFV